MTTVVDALLVTLGLDPSGLKKGYEDARKARKKYDDEGKKSTKQSNDDERKHEDERRARHKQDEARARATIGAIRQLRNETLGLLALFTGGVGIKNFIASTVEQAAGLKFLRENLNMSVESIQAYQRASERMGGTAAGAVAQLQESQRDLARLRTGQGPSEAMQATFRAAGMAGESLNMSDLRTGNDYLMARSRIIAKLYTQNAANAALMAAQMGISEDQFNLIKQGPAAIQKLIDAQRKNSVVSAADAEQALALKNTWLDFTDSMSTSGTKILVSLIPAFKQVLGWLQGVADWVAAHREDIAKWISDTIPHVLRLATEFSKFLRESDWSGVIAGAKTLLAIVSEIAGFIKAIGTGLGEGAGALVVGYGRASDAVTSGVSKVKSLFGIGSGTPPIGAASVANSSSSVNSSSVKINQMTITTQATDAAGIARTIHGELNRFGYVPQIAGGH